MKQVEDQSSVQWFTLLYGGQSSLNNNLVKWDSMTVRHWLRPKDKNSFNLLTFWRIKSFSTSLEKYQQLKFPPTWTISNTTLIWMNCRIMQPSNCVKEPSSKVSKWEIFMLIQLVMLKNIRHFCNRIWSNIQVSLIK